MLRLLNKQRSNDASVETQQFGGICQSHNSNLCLCDLKTCQSRKAKGPGARSISQWQLPKFFAGMKNILEYKKSIFD